MQDVPLGALGVCIFRAHAGDSMWSIWCAFCANLNLNPLLLNIDDPIPVLQIFAHRYRMGYIAPNQAPVHGRTVGDALRAVGQALASLGFPDPRLLPSRKLEFRLGRQLAAYNRMDPPPTHVKLIPIAIL